MTYGSQRRGRRMWVALTAGALLASLLAAGPPAAAGEPPPAQPEIIGGEDAAPGDFPFLAGLLIPGGSADPFDSQYCSASLISPRVLITAASCNPVPGEQVLLDQIDLETPITGEVLTVGKVSIHQSSDIALIRVTGVSAQTPIDVARPDDAPLYLPGTGTSTAGWGATAYNPPSASFPTRLQRADDLPVVSDADCEAAYGVVLDDASLICAGGEGVGGCIIDEGNPLVVGGPGNELLVGVASGGPEGCAVVGIPDVYTDPAAFTDFIDAHLDAPVFTDVDFGHGFLTEIWALSETGVLGGFPDGSYKPQRSVTRQAMSAFMYRLAGEPPFADPPTATFTDVPTTSTFFTEIEWMAAEGITNGFPGNLYKPAQAVSRQAMAAFMYRLLPLLPPI